MAMSGFGLLSTLLLEARSNLPWKAPLGHTSSPHVPQDPKRTIRLLICMVAFQKAHKSPDTLHTCQVCTGSTANIAVPFQSEKCKHPQNFLETPPLFPQCYRCSSPALNLRSIHTMWSHPYSTGSDPRTYYHKSCLSISENPNWPEYQRELS